MFDTKTKITALVGIVLSAVRIFFPNVPEGIEEHMNNVISAIGFLAAIFMRSALQKIEKKQ